MPIHLPMLPSNTSRTPTSPWLQEAQKHERNLVQPCFVAWMVSNPAVPSASRRLVTIDPKLF